mgnify:CR=1 FL=1
MLFHVCQCNIISLQEGQTRIVILKIQGIPHALRHLIDKAENTVIAAGAIIVHQTGLEYDTDIFIVILLNLQHFFRSISRADQQLTVELTADAKSHIIDAAYDPIYGARPLRRYLQHTVETLISKKIIADQVELIRQQVGDRKVLLALSGGVDSSVVAALLIRAIGKQLTCVHVNHGLLRKGEPEQVVEVFRHQMDANLIYVDAVDRFLDKLAGAADPEQKRKIIGTEFIRVFEEEARKLEGIEFLAQGTIYPDIIESGTKTVKAVKSHHNVGGLPEDLKFELVEPLKMLFKDEVRACGKALGLPDSMVYRQPFPGPGLGVRCLGAITRDRLEAVRESDAILREEFAKNGLEGKVWQYFTAIPDIKSVGVRDNKRADEWCVIIRAVNTVDAMTATVENVPFDLLQHITARITAEVKGVNRVLFDLTPKPTGTIEWE